MGKQPSSQPGQKDRIELQTLGRMQCHDIDQIAPGSFGIFHHQRDMLEESGKVLELVHRDDQFLEVLQTPGRLGRLVVHQHLGIAAFVENHLGEFGMGQRHPAIAVQSAPTFKIGNHSSQRSRVLGRSSSVVTSSAAAR